MNRRRRDLQRMSEAEAQRAGARLVTIESSGSGHLRGVFVKRGGESVSIFFSNTPNDVYSGRKAVADVRRALRR